VRKKAEATRENEGEDGTEGRALVCWRKIEAKERVMERRSSGEALGKKNEAEGGGGATEALGPAGRALE
jgi:hypothetical protein